MAKPQVTTPAQRVKRLWEDVVKHLFNDCKEVTPEKAEERMAICRQCVEWYDPETVQCKHCTCYLEISTTWESEECPIGKW